jgi:hypothetical protein
MVTKCALLQFITVLKSSYVIVWCIFAAVISICQACAAR